VPVPIVRQGGHLIASIHTSLTDEQWLRAQHLLASQIGDARSRSVIIDVGLLDVLDSFATRMLRSVAQSIRLRGVETVVVGIAPEVAYAMVRLGLDLADVDTALDLDDALDLLRRRAESSADAG